MFVGAIAAIGQTNIKRLMAYSSIAHMGYAMIGLAAGTAFGIEAMLTYMAIYVTMNIGTFAFILSMERDGIPVTDIDALRMYSKAEPGKAMALLVLLFSLAGVPPMLGFFAKLGVWQAGIDAGTVLACCCKRGSVSDWCLLLSAHRLLHVFWGRRRRCAQWGRLAGALGGADGRCRHHGVWDC